MQDISVIRYLIRRILVVLCAMSSVAAFMFAMRWLEARSLISTDFSQLGSIVYFHVASLSVLWLVLRYPHRWERVVVVVFWILLDYLYWIVVSSHDGVQFDVVYLPRVARATLLHRYTFYGLAIPALLFILALLSIRLIQRKDSELPAIRRNSAFRFSLVHAFGLVTYVAVGIAVYRLHGPEVQVLEVFSEDHTRLLMMSEAFIEMMRGVLLWTMAILLFARGRLSFVKTMVGVASLIILNLALFWLQAVLLMALMGQLNVMSVYYTPFSKSVESYVRQYSVHAVATTLLTVGSIFVVRLLGYEFVTAGAKSVGSTNVE